MATLDAIMEQEELKELEIPKDELADFLTELQGQVDKEETVRQIAFDKNRSFYKMYRGAIGRDLPDIPFEGSSDNRYRLGAMLIRTTRPAFYAAIVNAPKVTRYTPLNPKANASADRMEAYGELLYRGKLKNFRRTVGASASQFLIYGRTIVKITWCIETELRTMTYPAEKFTALLGQGALMKRQTMMAPLMQAAQAAQQQGLPPPPEPDEKALKAMELTPKEERAIIASVLGVDGEDSSQTDRLTDILKQLRAEEETIISVEDVVVRNEPDIRLVNLEDIILPVNSANCQEAEWIVHKLRFNDRELEAKSDENGGPYKNVADILKEEETGSEDTEQRQVETDHRREEGLTETEDLKGTYNIWECYCWVKRSWIDRFNGLTESTPDLMVRAVLTICPYTSEGEPSTILRAMELPYDHGCWPFEDGYYNFTEERFYASEGIMELCLPCELEENTSRNAAINRDTLAMSPPGFYDSDSGFEPTSHRQVGQMHPIDSRSFVATQGQPARFMQYPDLSSAANFDAQYAKARAAEMVGIPNLALLSGYQTAPTASQVEQVTSPAQAMQQYEIENWQEFWGRVFTQVHKLCKQYLFLEEDKKEVEFTNIQSKQSVKLSRQDFEYEYIIGSGGDSTLGNPVMEAQKRMAVFQLAMTNKALAPFVSVYDLWQQFVSKMLNYSEAQAIIPPREVAEKMQQAFLQMQSQAAQQEQEGKRTREPRIKQFNQAKSGIMPK